MNKTLFRECIHDIIYTPIIGDLYIMDPPTSIDQVKSDIKKWGKNLKKNIPKGGKEFQNNSWVHGDPWNWIILVRFFIRDNLPKSPGKKCTQLIQDIMFNRIHGGKRRAHLRHHRAEKIQWFHINDNTPIYWILIDNQTVLDKFIVLPENIPRTINYHRNPHFCDDEVNKTREYNTDTEDIKTKAENMLTKGQATT